MAFNPGVNEIRIADSSPNRKFNPLNSSVQFIPDLNLENPQFEQPSPQKEVIKQGILKTFYYQVLNNFTKDAKRKKTIGCNIYVNEMNEQQLQLSKRGKICRICIGEEETSRFINPCACKGSLFYVHEECLKLWILQKNGIEDVFKDRVLLSQSQIKCELCSYKFRMRLEIHCKFKLSRFQEIHTHQKICWLFQLFFIFGIAAIIAGILYEQLVLLLKYGFSNVGVDAIMTLLFVLVLILCTYLVASFVSQHQIEMIENWSIGSFRPRKDIKHNSVFQLQSQMGQSVSGSPVSRRKTQIIPQQINNLQVIQINEQMVSTNLSEQL